VSAVIAVKSAEAEQANARLSVGERQAHARQLADLRSRLARGERDLADVRNQLAGAQAQVAQLEALLAQTGGDRGRLGRAPGRSSRRTLPGTPASSNTRRSGAGRPGAPCGGTGPSCAGVRGPPPVRQECRAGPKGCRGTGAGQECWPKPRRSWRAWSAKGQARRDVIAADPRCREIAEQDRRAAGGETGRDQDVIGQVINDKVEMLRGRGRRLCVRSALSR